MALDVDVLPAVDHDLVHAVVGQEVLERAEADRLVHDLLDERLGGEPGGPLGVELPDGRARGGGGLRADLLGALLRQVRVLQVERREDFLVHLLLERHRRMADRSARRPARACLPRQGLPAAA